MRPSRPRPAEHLPRWRKFSAPTPRQMWLARVLSDQFADFLDGPRTADPLQVGFNASSESLLPSGAQVGRAELVLSIGFDVADLADQSCRAGSGGEAEVLVEAFGGLVDRVHYDIATADLLARGDRP